MAREDFGASLRRLAQSRKRPQTTAGAVGSMARLSALAGAEVLVPVRPATRPTCAKEHDHVDELPAMLFFPTTQIGQADLVVSICNALFGDINH